MIKIKNNTNNNDDGVKRVDTKINQVISRSFERSEKEKWKKITKLPLLYRL